MGAPYYRVIRGQFVALDKAPDGDSLRFVAERPALYHDLHRGYRIHPSGDGSVQLRFEGVDAPELHYGTAEQPMARTPRDQLLRWVGFHVEYDDPSDPSRVTACAPEHIACAILSQASDQHGRPVSYLLTQPDSTDLDDGDWTHVDDELLRRSLNFRLLKEGLAYCLVYTSTPRSHRRFLQEVAASVRRSGTGVWKQDKTAGFVLKNQDSIGRGGQLIFPKLFRRCTDYLKDVSRGFRGDLSDWLLAHSSGPRNENDTVVISGHEELRLSDLVEQDGRRISFQADLLDITFVEK